MQELITQIQSMVGGGNAILTTITSGSVIVWIVSNIKNIFNAVVNGITSIISFEIENSYEDARSVGFENKLRQTIFNNLISSSRQLWEKNVNLDLNDSRVVTKWNGKTWINVIHDVNVLNMKTHLTYGFSIRILNGTIVFCNRHTNNNNNKITTVTTLRVFFRRKKKFMKWLDEKIWSEIKKINENIKSNVVEIGYGDVASSEKNKRSIETIFTNNDVHKKLLGDINKFISNKEKYISMSYPYKYSAILEGVPGSGKSSTILAIASELGRNIEYINLSTFTMKDVMTKLNTDTNRNVYVFEDIDALNTNSSSSRENEKSENGQTCIINTDSHVKILSLSLSDLLNITDGLLSSDGAICLFTTNHIEKLDPALLRKGRMNGIYTFEYMNSETAEKMVKYHLGYSVGKMKDGIKPAELQETLLNVSVGYEDETSLEKFKEV